MTRRIALAVGDTPGHFYPALAVADAYRHHVGTVECTLFGPRDGLASALAARHGWPYEGISAAPIARAAGWGLAAAAVQTGRGIAEAHRALRHRRIQLAIGFGSFATGAVLLGARLLGRPTVIHEGNAVPGLANRWLAHVVDHACVSPWLDRASLAAPHLTVTGWPVRPSLDALVSTPLTPPSPGAAHLLVLSGSRDGASFARWLPSLVGDLSRLGVRVDVRHQMADGDAIRLEQAYRDAGTVATVTPFIEDAAAAYAWADLVVARAGAGTVAELALAGRPALLVPLPSAAHDHQADNAASMVAAGAAISIRERDWHEARVADQVATLLRPANWRAAADAARRTALPGAAGAVVAVCERLLGDAR